MTAFALAICLTAQRNLARAYAEADLLASCDPYDWRMEDERVRLARALDAADVVVGEVEDAIFDANAWRYCT